jgi:IclR family acetate operon transcriptional repressor
VAAPIYDEHAEPLGAISLAGPASRLPDDRIKHLGPLVSHIAEEITGRLGGRWPHPH